MANSVPRYMTVDEVAEMLRTSTASVYTAISRRKYPGVTKVGRRVLFDSEVLLDWLDQQRVPSLEDVQR